MDTFFHDGNYRSGTVLEVLGLDGARIKAGDVNSRKWLGDLLQKTMYALCRGERKYVAEELYYGAQQGTTTTTTTTTQRACQLAMEALRNRGWPGFVPGEGRKGRAPGGAEVALARRADALASKQPAAKAAALELGSEPAAGPAGLQPGMQPPAVPAAGPARRKRTLQARRGGSDEEYDSEGDSQEEDDDDDEEEEEEEEAMAAMAAMEAEETTSAGGGSSEEEECDSEGESLEEGDEAAATSGAQ
jgi:hypothetical protein